MSEDRSSPDTKPDGFELAAPLVGAISQWFLNPPLAVKLGVAGACALGVALSLWSVRRADGLRRPEAPAAARSVAPGQVQLATTSAHPSRAYVLTQARPAVAPSAAPAPPARPPAKSAGTVTATGQSAQAAPRGPRLPAEAARPRPAAPPSTAETTSSPSREAAGAACEDGGGPADAMVCADPVLAAAELRLAQAYERAAAAGVPERRLRRQQARWLAAREMAAEEAPWSVRDVYESRISELRNEAREAEGGYPP